jgi:hypothetical protein
MPGRNGRCRKTGADWISQCCFDSTAHALKFSNFQEMYFENSFPAEYDVVPKPELVNAPVLCARPVLKNFLNQENPCLENPLIVL